MTRYRTLVFVMCFLLTPMIAQAQEPWWPIQVKSYYGEYDTRQKVSGKASGSLSRAKLEEWVPPAPPAKSYTIGVCFPHLKDSYWVAVNYGIIQEARRLGVGIKLLEAGGYGELETQLAQMRQLTKAGVDGIILGAISYTGNDDSIAQAIDKDIPVVEAINDVHAPKVAAKALVSFYEMGYFAGEFVSEQAEKDGLNTVTVSFFPGPKESGWAPETLEGFKAAMKYFPGDAIIKDIAWGDTGYSTQRELLIHSLNKTGTVDYIVGNAIAADEAPSVLEAMSLDTKTKVVSTYLIPPLYDKIVQRKVAGAPSDLTVFQGRMAVNMMVRILEGETPGVDFPFRSGPFIPMVTPDNIDNYPFEGLFGPRGYTPVFSLAPGK